MNHLWIVFQPGQPRINSTLGIVQHTTQTIACRPFTSALWLWIVFRGQPHYAIHSANRNTPANSAKTHRRRTSWVMSSYEHFGLVAKSVASGRALSMTRSRLGNAGVKLYIYMAIGQFKTFCWLKIANVGYRVSSTLWKRRNLDMSGYQEN